MSKREFYKSLSKVKDRKGHVTVFVKNAKDKRKLESILPKIRIGRLDWR